jgi:hypothetical protein
LGARVAAFFRAGRIANDPPEKAINHGMAPFVEF